jgi:Tol biopolymer transport system component
MQSSTGAGIRVSLWLCAAAALCALPGSAWAQTERVSVASGGAQSSGAEETGLAISGDGRFVAFQARAANLVDGDLNGQLDVFVHDRETRTTSRVSISSEGAEGNADSSTPSISADGRYVVFTSSASNLVPGDSNQRTDVFVRDRATDQIQRASVATGGAELAVNSSTFEGAISADGRFVLFRTVGGPREGLLVRDRQRGTTELVTQGLIDPRDPGLRSRPLGVQAATISADGRTVAFASTGVLPGSGPSCLGIGLGDQVFSRCSERLYARERGTLTAVSPWERDLALSGDGRFLVHGTGLLEARLVVHDRALGQTQLIRLDLPGAARVFRGRAGAISADGRFLTYVPRVSLPGGDVVALHDRHTGAAELVSASSAGEPANGPSRRSAISADGRFVAFASSATNLVEGDSNAAPDIFVRDLNAARERVPGAYAIFEKDGVELIARLGHPAQFDALALEPPAGPPFHGSFQGARFAMIGSLSSRPSSVPGVPAPNLFFSGDIDPSLIDDSAVSTVFAALAAPGAFFDRWRELPTDGSQTSGLIDASDPRSLTSALGEPYPLAIRIDGQGRRTLVPGLGAAVRGQRTRVLPLLVSEHGTIERLTEAAPPILSELLR